MSYDSDPPRLAEGGPGTDGLQSMFERAQRDVPSDKTLDRMLTRLGPIAGAGAALAGDAVLAGAKTAATQAATTSTLTATITKLVAVVGGAGLIAGGAAIFASQSDDGAKAPAPVVAPPQAKAEVAAPPAAAPPLPGPVASPEEAAPSAVPPSKAGRADSKAETDTVKAEAALLERARSLATNNPSQALAVTREHARRFPNGLLAQEREVIAIEALRKLGKQDEASQRATKFQKTYPGSAHQRSVSSGAAEK